MLKFFVLFVFIIQPWLFGGLLRLELLGILISIFILFSKSKLTFNFNEVVLTFLLLAFVLSIPFFHFTFDISFFNVALKILIVFLGASLIVRAFSIERSFLLKIINFIVVFSLVFYFLAVLFEPVRGVAYAVKGETYGLEEKLEVYRLWFPSSAHTFHLGLFFFTALVIQMLNKEKPIWMVLTLLCASISSRTTLLIGGMLLMLYGVSRDKNLLVIFVVSLLLFFYFFDDIISSSNSAKYALEPIVNFLESGELSSKSSDKLQQKHLYFPNEMQLIFGDGRYFDSNGKFWGGTDSGIMRPLLYGGILFQFFYLYLMYKLLAVFYDKSIISVLVIISFFIMNIKAEFFIPGPHLALIFLYLFVNKGRRYE
ncbi:hypothetical protein EXT47_14225 [Pseudoalteromonas sp. CO342X]|uniref:hypothetical protein n=1 Tax=Pseudoalteromonas sp. CO342X TaxID=1777270 RepID=UPI001022B8C7|nr:hypothetical protein [Pseudoalteromonas sp. CO342X]RZG14183.1 hypothetical protein EXT47_14225 [Pseudoalteromonas sp. CO342X]